MAIYRAKVDNEGNEIERISLNRRQTIASTPAFYAAHVNDDGEEIERYYKAPKQITCADKQKRNKRGLSMFGGKQKEYESNTTLRVSSACTDLNFGRKKNTETKGYMSIERIGANEQNEHNELPERLQRRSDHSKAAADTVVHQQHSSASSYVTLTIDRKELASRRPINIYYNKLNSLSSTDALGEQLVQSNASDIESSNRSDTFSYTSDSSDIVPRLDLDSPRSSASSEDIMLMLQQRFRVGRIRADVSEAFATWLESKKYELARQALERKKAEEEERKKQQEREKLAKDVYNKWLAEKNSKISLEMKKPSSVAVLRERQAPNKTKSQKNAEEAKAKLKAWEHAKILEMEHRRKMQIMEAERNQKLKEQRRQLAEEAYQKWIATAASKPKPVPMNQGCMSLRSTISPIYTNPNKWQSILPETDDNEYYD